MTSPTSFCWQSPPADVITVIGHHLPLNDLLLLLRLNRHYTLSRHSQLNFAFAQVKRSLNHKLILALTTSLSAVRTLVLSTSSNLKAHSYRLLTGLTHITHLDVSYSHNLTADPLTHVLTAMRSTLTHLNVHGNAQINDSAVPAIAALSLRELDIGATSISDGGFEKLFAFPQTNSRALTATMASHAEAAICFTLIRLDLTRSLIGVRGLHALSANVADVTSLCLDECTAIDEDCISVVGTMTSLHTVSLRNVQVAPLSLCALRPLKNLHEIAVGALATDRLLKQMSECHPKLVSLYIPCSPVTSIGLSSLSSIQTLSHINIGGCEHISSDIKDVASVCHTGDRMFSAAEKIKFFGLCHAEADIERRRQHTAHAIALRALALQASARNVQMIVENTFRLLGKRCRNSNDDAVQADSECRSQSACALDAQTVMDKPIYTRSVSNNSKQFAAEYTSTDWVRISPHQTPQSPMNIRGYTNASAAIVSAATTSSSTSVSSSSSSSMSSAYFI